METHYPTLAQCIADQENRISMIQNQFDSLSPAKAEKWQIKKFRWLSMAHKHLDTLRNIDTEPTGPGAA